MKQTENEIILHLLEHLKKEGWSIESYCLGQTRGYDVVAVKDGEILYVEAKGARADDNAPTRKRIFFDSGQIKTHFGKALVKMLEVKHENPKAKYAIAHPDDKDIRKSIGHLVPYLETLNIQHYWISENGKVTKE
jgi:hypothetical protein